MRELQEEKAANKAAFQIMEPDAGTIPAERKGDVPSPPFLIDARYSVVCPIFDARRSQIYGGGYILLGVTDSRDLSPAAGTMLGMTEDAEALQGQMPASASGDARRAADSAQVLFSGHLRRMYAEAIPGGAYDLPDFIERVRSLKAITLFGDGVPVYGQRIRAACPETEVFFAQEPEALQTASSVAKLALDMYCAGETLSYEALLPDYMRKAEAERRLEEGTLKVHGNV